MKKLLIAIAAVMITAATYGQGQVVFANRVGAAGLDAPVFITGTQNGPGADYSVQLYLQGAGGALTPLTPTSTFLAPTAAAPTRDRYWASQTVDVPGISPGGNATFVVRAWKTSDGSYDLSQAKGESAAVTVAVGGGTLPPANLVGLQGFNVTVVPEPSVIALGVLGAAALLFRRKKQ